MTKTEEEMAKRDNDKILQGHPLTPEQEELIKDLHEGAAAVIKGVKEGWLQLNHSQILDDWFFLASGKSFVVITPDKIGMAKEVTKEESKITWACDMDQIPLWTAQLWMWLVK
jgi:hypothetical protein